MPRIPHRFGPAALVAGVSLAGLIFAQHSAQSCGHSRDRCWPVVEPRLVSTQLQVNLSLVASGDLKHCAGSLMLTFHNYGHQDLDGCYLRIDGSAPVRLRSLGVYHPPSRSFQGSDTFPHGEFLTAQTECGQSHPGPYEDTPAPRTPHLIRSISLETGIGKTVWTTELVHLPWPEP